MLGYFFLNFFFPCLRRIFPLGSAVEQMPKILVNAMGNLFPQQSRSSKQKQQGAEVAKEEWADEVHAVVWRLEKTGEYYPDITQEQQPSE